MMTCAQMPPLSAAPAELRWLRGRVAELEARHEILAAQLAALDAAQAQLAVLAKQAGELQRRLGKDSSTSSKPPSSGNPYKKEPPGPVAVRPVRAAAGQIVADGPPADVVTEDLPADVYRVQARVIPHPAIGLLSVVPLPRPTPRDDARPDRTSQQMRDRR